MAMLTGPLAEQNEIEIPDIESDTFEQVLQYIDYIYMLFLYTDDIIIDGNNVVRLFVMCNKYNIDYLEENCLKYIWQNGDAFLKSDSFCDLSYDFFVKVIEADQLKASEESVFEASIAWSEAECIRQGREVTPENRRSVLGDSMHLIRYSKIDPEYFVQKVSLSSLLTEAEENKIFRSFIIRGEDVSPFSSRYRKVYVRAHIYKMFKNIFLDTSVSYLSCISSPKEGAIEICPKRCAEIDRILFVQNLYPALSCDSGRWETLMRQQKKFPDEVLNYMS
ncbi:BTB/POZ domain-containing protein 6-like [Gigantopelta aegis]|uniref:BTB/POZ domain-containing protein 6-like n=1 Tax=Gigantopelta aegis TaxID=1735272 RepID=UPI001B887C0A|nr:BTB/POZ domain-containing protein 6-like [Gigantopelta aegis]